MALVDNSVSMKQEKQILIIFSQVFRNENFSAAEMAWSISNLGDYLYMMEGH